MLNRIRILLLALVALAAVAAPAAVANPNGPIRSSFELPQLELFDLSTSTVCGQDVFANVSGTVDRTLYFDKDGNATHQIEAFHGGIEWFTRGSGKSYRAALVNRVRIDFLTTNELFEPVKVTVTGHHGGVFPIGGGPAGNGTLVYDGFVYAHDEEFAFWATDGDPIETRGNFHTTARRICAALA
jgi:hypothetical protein